MAGRAETTRPAQHTLRNGRLYSQRRKRRATQQGHTHSPFQAMRRMWAAYALHVRRHGLRLQNV